MYNLYKLGDDLYEIHSSFGETAMQGTLLAILTYATHNLKFDPDELQQALLNMLETDMDSAQFGINRTFIFAFNKDTKRPKSRKSG